MFESGRGQSRVRAEMRSGRHSIRERQGMCILKWKSPHLWCGLGTAAVVLLLLMLSGMLHFMCGKGKDLVERDPKRLCGFAFHRYSSWVRVTLGRQCD